MKPVNLEEFQNDFCLTLSQSGHRVEIAKGWGKQGADHYEELTPAILERILGQNKNINIGILGSVIFEDIEGSRAGDEAIKQKNYLAFDLDLKDSLPDSKEWDYPKKRAFVKTLFYAHKEKIEACGLGPVWFALYSGNGLHVWFRSNSPLKFDSSKDYNKFYLECLKRLNPAIGMELDDSCQNPSRLMRLPNSFNCGKPNKPIDPPIQTEVIYHSKEADSSKEIHGLWFDTLEQPKEREKSNLIPLRKSQSILPQSDAHKDRVKAALTCEAVLKHYGYDKWDSKKIEGGKTFISSPWSTDSDPSFQIESNFFIDRSSGKKGDVFNLLAYLYEWDVMADFPKVLEIGEQITGIHSPKGIAGKKRQGEANGQSKADSESESKKFVTREDYFDLFRKHLPDLCKDILTGQMLFKEKNGSWGVAMNALPWLEAEGSDCGLSPSMVGRWLSNYGNKHLEPRLLIDIPEWDGIDRIETIAKCVHIKNSTGLTQKDFEEHLKFWGSGIFERLSNSNFQNPLFLLVGSQGLGKDFLIQAMVGNLGRYYAEGSIGRKAEDDYQLMARSLVINLAEFDRTAKADIGYLKDLIYKPQATFRQPYDRAPGEVNFHCSWIASSNETDLLRDSSGNRRFVIFEIEKIDRNYPTDQSLQILAQFRALKGCKVNLESQEAMASYIKDKTPPTIDEMILERFDNRMNSNFYKSKGQKVCGHDAQILIDEIAKETRQTPNKVLKVLKDNGRSKKGTGNKREVFLPGNGV